MADRAADPSPVLIAQAATLRGIIVRGFGASKGPNGESWPALKQPSRARTTRAATAATSSVRGAKARKVRRAKRARPPGKPLLDTSLLRRSIVTSAEGDSIVFGVSGARRVIAPTHQFGSPGRNIAPRPFLPMDRAGDPLFESGNAASWLRRAKAAIAKYMLHGEA
jgi:phage gpG-like protein